MVDIFVAYSSYYWASIQFDKSRVLVHLVFDNTDLVDNKFNQVKLTFQANKDITTKKVTIETAIEKIGWLYQ